MRASQLITEMQSRQPQTQTAPPPPHHTDKNTLTNNKKNGKDKKSKGKSVLKNENNGNNEKENEEKNKKDEKNEKELILAMENLMKIRKNTFSGIKMHLDFSQNAQYPLIEFKS